MGQAFQLMNGPLVNEMLSTKEGLVTQLAEDQNGIMQITEELYWKALSRQPTSAEFERIAQHFEKNGRTRAAFEDLLWSLVNAKEFLFR